MFYLGLNVFVFLPLSASVVVLFPLTAGWGGTVSIIVVETVPQTLAVSEFTPVVVTGTGRLDGQTKVAIITNVTEKCSFPLPGYI